MIPASTLTHDATHGGRSTLLAWSAAMPTVERKRQARARDPFDVSHIVAPDAERQVLASVLDLIDHDHGDGPVCPGCRFREELAEELDWAAGQDEPVWHRVVGEIQALAAGTLVAITLLRASRLDDAPDDEHARTLATAITRMGGAIQELRHALMDGDERDTDPGTGL